MKFLHSLPVKGRIFLPLYAGRQAGKKLKFKPVNYSVYYVTSSDKIQALKLLVHVPDGSIQILCAGQRLYKYFHFPKIRSVKQVNIFELPKGALYSYSSEECTSLISQTN